MTIKRDEIGKINVLDINRQSVKVVEDFAVTLAVYEDGEGWAEVEVHLRRTMDTDRHSTLWQLEPLDATLGGRLALDALIPQERDLANLDFIQDATGKSRTEVRDFCIEQIEENGWQ